MGKEDQVIEFTSLQKVKVKVLPHIYLPPDKVLERVTIVIPRIRDIKEVEVATLEINLTQVKTMMPRITILVMGLLRP